MTRMQIPFISRLTRRRSRVIRATLLFFAGLASLVWVLHNHNVKVRAIELQNTWKGPLASHYARTGRRDTFIARLLLSGFGELDRYKAANRRLPPASPDRVVLYGDSITEFWPRLGAKEFFPSHNYLDRGIGGQATPELLWRFRQDALDLHPGTIVLLGGANDILLQRRYLGLLQTEENLRGMVEAAQQSNIRVILCLLTPISAADADRRARDIHEVRELNEWIRNYAAQKHVPSVNYYDILATSDGSMRADLSVDGIHPNNAGYALMLPLAQRAIDGDL